MGCQFMKVCKTNFSTRPLMVPANFTAHALPRRLTSLGLAAASATTHPIKHYHCPYLRVYPLIGLAVNSSLYPLLSRNPLIHQ